MSGRANRPSPTRWTAIPDADGHFSSGIAALDRLLGGGYERGSFVLLRTEAQVTTADLHLLLTPTWLNFLSQSRGLMLVLPARESPRAFRSALLRHVSRRLFDSRVRIIDYVQEDDPAPYIVHLPIKGDPKVGMEKMTVAERAVAGATHRPFLEYNALEMMETLVGAETAGRMFLHGMKRARAVGNLGVAVARPGLASLDGARSLCDREMLLRRDGDRLLLAGIRPAFPEQLVVADDRRGAPFATVVPRAG